VFSMTQTPPKKHKSFPEGVWHLNWGRDWYQEESDAEVSRRDLLARR